MCWVISDATLLIQTLDGIELPCLLIGLLVISLAYMLFAMFTNDLSAMLKWPLRFQIIQIYKG